MAKKPRKPTAVEKKLVGVADLVITAAEKRKDPTIAIPVRSLSNVEFNERKGLIEMGKRKQARSFFNVAMAKKFMQTVLVADALSELQRANLTTSLREIYYRTKHTIKDSHENTLDTQDESDPIIEDLEVTLTTLPRFSARTWSSSRSAVSATSRSSMSGSDSFWASNVFSCEPFIVCLVR